ncbi:FUSC family protein [Teichococcus wenyumeiae]|nr:FUSC family protein [Pseudoroseomonas wenyumeiae]
MLGLASDRLLNNRCNPTRVEGILSEKQTGTTSLPSDLPLTFWHGDGLLGRSVRFTFALMAPIVVGLMVGASGWVAYAILTCILSYMLDTGGTALSRVPNFAVAALIVIAGAGIGTLAYGDPRLTALALGGTAMLYGIVEGLHPSAAAASRFLCLAVTIAALYSPVHVFDIAVVGGCALYGWVLSVSWDAATGIWRPSAGLKLEQISAYLKKDQAARLVFASVTGMTVAGSFLLARSLGLEHLNWAILALILVLHSDAEASRRTARNLFSGTLLGVAVAWLYGTLFESPSALIFGMTVAAIIRWPVQQRKGSLGFAAMAVFIVLLLQLVAHLTGHPSHAPADRLIDISIGCAISIVAVYVNAAAQWLLHRASS